MKRSRIGIHFLCFCIWNFFKWTRFGILSQKTWKPLNQCGIERIPKIRDPFSMIFSIYRSLTTVYVHLKLLYENMKYHINVRATILCNATRLGSEISIVTPPDPFSSSFSGTSYIWYLSLLPGLQFISVRYMLQHQEQCDALVELYQLDKNLADRQRCLKIYQGSTQIIHWYLGKSNRKQFPHIALQ